MKTLKVINTEIKTDKNGREYNLVSVETPSKVATLSATGEKIAVKVKNRASAFTAYKESYLNDKPEFGWDLVKGDHIAGNLETRQVLPYDIEGTDGTIREANSYTAIVLGDTDSPSFAIEVAKAFKAADKTIVVEETANAIADASVELNG